MGQRQGGDLAGAVVVNLPMEQTNRDIHKNRAMLITTALVTAILAMVASYVIVRYVIVRSKDAEAGTLLVQRHCGKDAYRRPGKTIG